MKVLLSFSGIAIVLVCTMLATFAMHHLTPEQQLGQKLYFDENLSLNRNQSCATCHDPEAGFADPKNVAEPINRPVSEGSIAGKFGDRNGPTAAYMAYSPFFHWNADEGLYIGGQFWDGRSNTLAEQAAGPFLNPVEMAMPNEKAVVQRLTESSEYIQMFKDVYNIDLAAIDFTKATDAMGAPGVMEAYDLMVQAIGAFEKSSEFNRFDSKFDYFLAGKVQLTAQEWNGLKLFEGKAQCSLCHISKPFIAPDGSEIPPIFTDFTYDNLGLPPNPQIAKLRGEPQPADKGLGVRDDIAAVNDLAQLGKFKVSTLRNIALTAPYGHNGVFDTLEEIVHFYNTRDALEVCDEPEDEDFGEECWPAPEIQQNVNTEELGNLELTEKEEKDLIAFLLTLSDGWGPANNMEPLPRPAVVPMP